MARKKKKRVPRIQRATMPGDATPKIVPRIQEPRKTVKIPAGRSSGTFGLIQPFGDGYKDAGPRIADKPRRKPRRKKKR